jgi:hypothetical protein
MAKEIKRKASFGTVNVNSVSPAPSEGWAKAMNINISFEDALKLHLGLGQILGHLNGYNRSTKEGRSACVNLCYFPHDKAITINEGKLKD